MENNENGIPAVNPGTGQPDPENNEPTVADLQKQIATLTAALAKQKKAVDTATSEAASWRRQYQDTLSEADKEKLDRQEADKKTAARIAELERKDAINTHTQTYLAMGYDAEAAKASAEAWLDGDTAKLISLQKDHEAKIIAQIKTTLLDEQPGVTPGKTPTGVHGEDSRLTAFKKGALRGY